MENQNSNIRETTEKPVEYAGFWWRFLASIIDGIILSVVSWIVILPFLGIFGISIYSIKEMDIDPDEALMWLLPLIGAYSTMILLMTALKWLYFAIMESSKTQGTLGKMALNIKVTDYNGDRISFARATGRYFGKIISSMIFMIGYIIAGFTDKKQALHDMIASCYVIKE